MCMGPNVQGRKLRIVDYLGSDTTPTCCGKPMSPVRRDDDYQDYKCAPCGTVLTVEPDGHVFDIVG
ncbi:hypothetical protein ACFU9B_42255 [Streptomyces sp. NPDC057592]|uniref:hypothetical protein n=1 Tax=unclassified Streptomyces TaxID=2593676 RepID=UPI0036BB06EB